MADTNDRTLTDTERTATDRQTETDMSGVKRLQKVISASDTAVIGRFFHKVEESKWACSTD